MSDLTHKDEAYVQTLESLKDTFEARGGANPFSEEGFRNLISNDKNRERYVGKVEELFSEESERDAWGKTIQHSIDEARNPFSTEGYGALGSNDGFSPMAHMAPMTIVGYSAKAYALNFFHTINHENHRFTMEYRNDTIRMPNGEIKSLTKGMKEGAFGGILDLPKIDFADADVGSFDALILADGVKCATLNVTGNLYDLCDMDERQFSVGRNIGFDQILTTDDGGTTVVATKVYTNRDEKTGNQSERIIIEDIKVGNSMITVMCRVNIETGDFIVTAGNPSDGTEAVMGVTFSGHFVDNANTLIDAPQPGVQLHVQTFDAEWNRSLNLPLSQEVIEDFNIGGHGVSSTAYFLSNLTDLFASAKDSDLEALARETVDRDSSSYPLYNKLGGSKLQGTFDMAARRDGGDDPYAWATQGVQRTLKYMLQETEADTDLNNDIPREWVFLGWGTDVEAIAGMSFSRNDSAGESSGFQKNGFAINGTVGYADNVGQRLRLVGSRETRHKGKPVFGTLKSGSLKQPTGLYFPYSFKVFQGFSPDAPNIPAVRISSRDWKGFMAATSVELTLKNNDADLYKKITDYTP